MLLLALACWAGLAALTTVPGNAPVVAWLGALRDTVLLFGAAVACLATVQPKTERIRDLMDRHRAKTPAGPGTAHRPGES